MTKHQLLFRFEQMVTIGALILYSGGPLQVILSGGASQGDDTGGIAEPDYGIIRLLCMLTYVVFSTLLIYRWKQAVYGIFKARFVLALVFIALLSYLWSDYPSITMNRGIALFGTSLFGIYFGSRFTLKQQLNLLGWSFGIIVFLSFAFAVALPRYGIMGGVHAGTWRGIFTHKNVAGRAMVLSSTVFLILAAGAPKFRPLPWFLLLLSVFFVIMTRSFTALTNLGLLISIFFALKIMRWRYDVRLLTLITSFLLAGSAYIVVMLNLENILAAFGKDLTLTGRSELWPLVIEMIERRPWFGYGYGGFWQGINSAAGEVWRAYGWAAPHSHNGFLDLSLDLGLITLGLFLFELFAILLLSVIRINRTQGNEYFLCVLFPLFIALYSLTESTIMGRNTLFWVVFVAIAISTRIPIPIEQTTSETLSKENDNLRNLQLQRD